MAKNTPYRVFLSFLNIWSIKVKKIIINSLLAMFSLMFIFGNAQAVPIIYEGSLTSGVTVNGDVPQNSYSDSSTWDFWSFSGVAGDVVTIILDRTSDQMDPGVELFFGLGGDTAGLTAFGNNPPNDGLLTYLTSDDDGGSDTPPGPFSNSLISGFTLASTGTYTIAAYDVLGASTGPWTYALTARGFTGSVPEPVSIALFGLGLAGIGFARKKKSA